MIHPAGDPLHHKINTQVVSTGTIVRGLPTALFLDLRSPPQETFHFWYCEPCQKPISGGPSFLWGKPPEFVSLYSIVQYSLTFFVVVVEWSIFSIFILHSNPSFLSLPFSYSGHLSPTLHPIHYWKRVRYHMENQQSLLHNLRQN